MRAAMSARTGAGAAAVAAGPAVPPRAVVATGSALQTRTVVAAGSAASHRAVVPAAIVILTLIVAMAAPGFACAQTLTLNTSPAPGGATTYSVPIQTLLVFTALSFLPAVLLLMTSFTRIIIVLSLLRQALGLQATPPNQVLIGLALFMTLFVMGPTLEKIHEVAYKPYTEQAIGFDEALARGSQPLRVFMMRQTREADVTQFARMAQVDPQVSVNEVPMRVLIPAFAISELKTAFQAGFMVFVPFLIIDLIVASILMSMGMMMLSPVLVSLPFKLMLFVLADGWNLLAGSLVASFGT
jgi:flagellar biosynthetic protein FliP